MSSDSGIKKVDAPSIADFQDAAARLGDWLVYTPVVPWVGPLIDSLLSKDSAIFAKLELFQRSGSFKARAALLRILSLEQTERKTGVVAVSAGNHAIAVSYAADVLGVSAKVVMPSSVSSERVAKCRMRGAEVVLVPTVQEAFVEAERIAKTEQRTLLHPFEGRQTALGTGTLGLEFYEQVHPSLDAMVLSVGGGGLAAGIASAVRQAHPKCEIYGVEPIGAASISNSLKHNKPSTLASVDTIASSLAAPYALPYSFSLCQQYLTEVVTVSDQELCNAMALVFYELKLAIEPSCAAVVAAMIGPLKNKLKDKRIGLVFCGSSIDSKTFSTHLATAESWYQTAVQKVSPSL